MKSNAVEVNTFQYEFTHGRKPKGRGYWAFQIGDNYGPYVYFNDTFANAKKAAIKKAKELGEKFIIVLP